VERGQSHADVDKDEGLGHLAYDLCGQGGGERSGKRMRRWELRCVQGGGCYVGSTVQCV
jgi:hypothetical protein